MNIFLVTTTKPLISKTLKCRDIAKKPREDFNLLIQKIKRQKETKNRQGK